MRFFSVTVLSTMSKFIKLNNGYTIPTIGLGTYKVKDICIKILYTLLGINKIFLLLTTYIK